ncbi:MAG: heme NO-binding domain-containing protein [Desulfobulbaceae bacterium]
MKGIIFNMLEQFINDRFGEETFEEIVAASGPLSGDTYAMVSPGSYPDSDFIALLGQTARTTGMDRASLLQAMGRHSLPLLAQRYPHFFSGYSHPRDFLKTTSLIHQVEVKKLYQDAEVPRFTIEDQEGGMMVTYHSSRRLCHFVAGLLMGLSDYYRVPMVVQQVECILEGGRACTFMLSFSGQGAGEP